MTDLRSNFPKIEIDHLDNGLTLALLPEPQTPVVAMAMAYRAGTRDDAAGHGGTAHFLEHMMFKGAERYALGEVDRVTRALGGSNNAFTSHDLTVYYFTFAADRWHRALDIESDRMASLTLDPSEIDSERQVILEEIAMYEGEPWDALEQRVAATAFPDHPYGRPVLGTREELEATDGTVLRAFHELYYQPGNAVLVLSGNLGDDARGRAHEAFGSISGHPRPDRFAGSPTPPQSLVRLERHAGEVARLLVSLPAPAATHPDHPRLRLLLAVLGAGRSSRLHRALVDEGQLCVGISADLNESVDPSALSLALEVLPGIEPERAEEALLTEIRRLRENPPTEEEVERSKKIALADWIFDHEKVHQQAFLVGTALALFDIDHPWRYHEDFLATTADDLVDVAERYLRFERGGVLGWSLPQEDSPQDPS